MASGSGFFGSNPSQLDPPVADWCTVSILNILCPQDEGFMRTIRTFCFSLTRIYLVPGARISPRGSLGSLIICRSLPAISISVPPPRAHIGKQRDGTSSPQIFRDPPAFSSRFLRHRLTVIYETATLVSKGKLGWGCGPPATHICPLPLLPYHWCVFTTHPGTSVVLKNLVDSITTLDGDLSI